MEKEEGRVCAMMGFVKKGKQKIKIKKLERKEGVPKRRERKKREGNKERRDGQGRTLSAHAILPLAQLEGKRLSSHYSSYSSILWKHRNGMLTLSLSARYL